jgi:hypothetical protein
MSFMQPKVPKMDPEVKASQEMQRQAEAERRRELKEQQLQRTKASLGSSGIRSLISGSSGAGFGRNFF